MQAKLVAAGVVLVVVSLAIADHAPEMIGQKIAKEVNRLPIRVRLFIALRVVFGKLKVKRPKGFKG